MARVPAVLVTVAGFCSARSMALALLPFGAWLGGCLGSAAVRPAVPARRLPFLLVVLCKGCPVALSGFSARWPQLIGASFGGGALLARIGSVCGCRSMWCRSWWLWVFGVGAVGWCLSAVGCLLSVSCLGKGCPSPLFSRFFSSSFLLPP